MSILNMEKPTTQRVMATNLCRGSLFVIPTWCLPPTTLNKDNRPCSVLLRPGFYSATLSLSPSWQLCNPKSAIPRGLGHDRPAPVRCLSVRCDHSGHCGIAVALLYERVHLHEPLVAVSGGPPA